MPRRIAPNTGRNALLVLTALLVTVGALAPGPALAREDAGPSADVVTETEPNEY